MRWRLILEEYGPEIIYIKGSTNIVADALSRLNIPVTEENVNAKIFVMIREANALLYLWHGETKSNNRRCLKYFSFNFQAHTQSAT